MQDIKMNVVEKPRVGRGKSRNYVFNRSPLRPSCMAKLPLGSIRPFGWLKRQLDLMVTGMTGRLMELSSFLKPDNGWFGGDNPGWEEQPYWLRGFHSLAVLTGNKDLLAEAHRWLEAVINSQAADGYFGAQYHKCVVGKNGQKVCDLWPHMVMLDSIIGHYEHTGDARVIPWMERFFKFCAALPEDQFIPVLREGFGDWKPAIQQARAGDMLSSIYWLYNQTGSKFLLLTADRFYRHLAPPASEWLDSHIVHFTQRVRYFAEYYMRSQCPWHLAATEYWYHQHLSTWGQQPRGIFGADEVIRAGYTDPRQGFETCGIVEFNKSFYILGRLTGESKYADRCEDVTLNYFPAAQTPDLKGLHYLTASNQPQLDRGEHDYSNGGMMAAYSPEDYRCCQHNVSMGWPWYVENLWQATPDNGLMAWLYADNEVTAKVGSEGTNMTIVEQTDYPFSGKVVMKILSSQAVTFPLYLRIPRWCQEFRVELNNQELKAVSQPGKYLRLERNWSAGDMIAIEMRMNLGVTVWPRTGAVTVDRGPLSYSVKIGEQWQRCGGTDPWPKWEVLPTTPWNYGLVINPQAPVASLKVIEKGAVANQPWTVDAAPIEIKAKAKRIPRWGMAVKQTVDPLQPSPIQSAEPEEEITMIPMGCARLRMSCLPVIGDGPVAQEWKKP